MSAEQSHRAIRILVVSWVVALCISPAASAQQLPPSHPTTDAQQTPATSVVPLIPVYPDSPKGLEDLMREMMKLQKKKNGGAEALAPYVQSLVLPNARAWFKATFGDQMGGQLADSYHRTRMNMPLAFLDVLNQMNSKHFGQPRAIVFTDSCNPDATAAEYQVLISRANEQPLYDIRLTSSSQGAVVSYFAYVDGAFRYIGNFQLRVPATRMVQVDGKAMAKKIKMLGQAMPIYPEDAKIDHVQGKVLLHAIIGQHGEVCSLQLIQGNPLLASAAIAAVRQWRYSPYALSGKPVSVDTTITVIFNLGD